MFKVPELIFFVST